MLYRQGFTLIEMVVVLLITGICIALAFVNFSTPTEQARALTARNNLLAIYSAEQNYSTNNGFYCTSSHPASDYCTNLTGDNSCGDNVNALNCNLSLSIQDDGMYSYACLIAGGGCSAWRNNGSLTPDFELSLVRKINLNGGANANPSCSSTSNPSWCP